MTRHSLLLAAAYIGTTNGFVVPSGNQLKLVSSVPRNYGSRHCMVKEIDSFITDEDVNDVQTDGFTMCSEISEYKIVGPTRLNTITPQLDEMNPTDIQLLEEIISKEVFENEMISHIDTDRKSVV